MQENNFVEEKNYKDPSIPKIYKAGVDYQREMGFLSKWPEYERFLAGDQWPGITERTKALPRPVFNIIAFIQAHKKASVGSETIKMVFSSTELKHEQMIMEDESIIGQAITGADDFSKICENIWEKIDMEELIDEFLVTASNLGTGVMHFYWDTAQNGGLTYKYVGDIAGEVIDPANVHFANPQARDVQNQKYIVISSREDLDQVRDVAKKNNVPDSIINLIREDKKNEESIYDTEKKEVEGNAKVTVLTKYYKKDGFIYFKKSVGDIVFKPETNTNLTQYPIVVMNWKPRKKCIYGIGDTEGVIPNQKAVNFLLAMMLLSVQQTAWPKIIAKAGALTQNITNQPGEILIDKSLNGDGIKYLQGAAFNPVAINLVDKFVDLTRTVNGANDAAMGEAPGADMAAQAIMLLQRSAGVPIEDVKKRYYRAMKRAGRIWEDMIKAKYNMPRLIKVKSNEGNEEQSILITGTDYAGVPFDLKVDIGPGSTYSEFMAQSTLDKLYDKGSVDTITYLRFSSRNSAPFKNELIKALEAQMAMMPPMPPMGGLPGGTPVNGTMPKGIESGDPTMGIPEVKEPSLGAGNNGKM